MYRAILTSFVAIACLLPASTAWAFPANQPVPGGVAIVPLASVQANRPIVYYAGQRVTVVPRGDAWVALVGIPLDAQSGEQVLQFASPVDGRSTQGFQVAPTRYKTQRVTIRDKNKVNPDEASSQRIVQEMEIQQQLKTRFVEQEAMLDFIRPVQGRDSGRFGLRRIINGEPRSPHSGMDIAAAQGTPVRSAAAGQVIYTGNMFFSGNVVYVDHGSGVISLYAHLSKVKVKVGDRLGQGSVVGLVGKTGRATGPHLHWSVYLNGGSG